MGVAVTTVGRWPELERLLESLDRSTVVPVGVAIANQSGAPAPASLSQDPRVVVVPSGGGISRGRNDAVQALAHRADVIAFPNDNCTFQPDTIAAVTRRFKVSGQPAAVAGALAEPGGVRFSLPGSGELLDRWTVWRAIEPALFIDARVAATHRFNTQLGSGSDSPWQAGEGTELLLRLLGEGHRIVADPRVVVEGPGERRSLTRAEFRVKLRSYGRGVGYVLRLHRAGPLETALHLALPWYRFVRKVGDERASASDCFTQSLGRCEGRLGRCIGGGARLDAHALRK